MSGDFNSLSIEVYSSGSTLIIDPANDLANAGGITFNTGYPGGLYLDATITIPRQILKWMPIKGNQRVVLRNGMKTVYEGWIDTLDHSAEETSEGVLLNINGGWGRYMMRRGWRKDWANQLINEATWGLVTGNQEDMFTVDRYNRLCAVPKDGISYVADNQVVWRYIPPTGETVKRIVFNYNLQEAAQAWELVLWDNTNASGEWNVASTGTGTEDHTLATPSSDVQLIFKSKATQTGIGNGTIFGRFSSITVYTETGSINLTEIAKDVIGEMSTELNSDTGQVGSNTLDLTPFVTEGHEMMADILTRACDAGDSSYNSWGAQLLESEMAATPNGKPVLQVAQYPALTDYDYAVRIGDDNLLAPFQVTKDYSEIWNWIAVTYMDGEGKTKYLSPDDDSDLKDTTSITDYGQREQKLELGHATITEAEMAGRRYLARYKDPQWMMTNPIVVKGWIRAKSGNLIPSSMIRAGKRIRIEDYPLDLSGTGLTFMISHTTYEDEDESCSLQAGPPPDLIYAMTAPAIILPDDPNAGLEPEVPKKKKKGKGKGKK
jgi:hypothetical protein